MAAQPETGSRRSGIPWKRVVLWSIAGLLVVVLAAGGAFYLWFRSQVGAANARTDPAIIEALAETPSSTTTVTTPPPSTTAPSGPTTTASSTTASSTTTLPPPTGMNLVLLGSDRRESEGDILGRSDTIILVHIDPDRNFLSMLSVPRDLQVQVPGHGTRKINAAYAYGGAALVIRTIQQELGVDLDHYMEVDFNAFKEITDTLGGVYVDVDRRYDDGKIQLSAGYQLLDGLNALRFVRTRHDYNIDFGRMQRQQRFLSALREQAMGWNLPLKLPGLIKALFDNVDTDLGANDILRLAYWGVRLDGDRMKQSSIVAKTGTIDGVSYVLATDEQIAVAVKDFLTEPAAVETVDRPSANDDALPLAGVTVVDLGGASVDVLNGTGRTGQAGLAAAWLSRLGAAIGSVRATDHYPLEGTEVTYPAGREDAARAVALALGIATLRPSSAVGRVTVTLGGDYRVSRSQFSPAGTPTPVRADIWEDLAAETPLPLVAPTYVPSSCRYSFHRSYEIVVGDGTEPAARVGFRYKGEDQYLGLSATAWLEAPLAGGGETIEDDGTTYTVVGTSTKPDHVWWVEDDVLFWVSNTLLYELTEEELLAVAMTTVPYE